MQHRDENYGKGEHQIDGDFAEAMASTEEFTARLRAHFASPGYTPPVLPKVALDVHSLSQKAEVDVRQVVSVLEKDALLAARVLKIAQSAAYAARSTIPSLQDAVVRIGLRSLSDIAWEVSAGLQVFRSTAYAPMMEIVHKHATATAYLARQVAQFTSIATEYAFLCGLLHDIGMAAALIVLGDRKKDSEVVDEAMLVSILRQCHAEASQTIATLWKLPADVQLVLGHHHRVAIDGFVHPLTAVVAIAEDLARELGLGVSTGAGDCDATDLVAIERAKKALGLDERRMVLLREQAQKLAATLGWKPAATAAAR